MYLKLGFALCVFMTSAERRRKTHMLLSVSIFLSILSEIYRAYLAPMTMVLLLRTYFSKSTYMPPGIVPNAAFKSTLALNHYCVVCLRPVKSAKVTSVPNSASKRSIRGVTARRLKIMWKKLRCINGNKLSRCTAKMTKSASDINLVTCSILERPKFPTPCSERNVQILQVVLRVSHTPLNL